MAELHLAPRSALLEGARKLAAAVGCTAGPSGRLVALGRTQGWTKDGVSVARNITLPDPLEQLGAAALQQAAQRQVDAVGDGTTQVVVLANTLAQELTATGLDPQRLMRAVDERVPQILASIKSAARDATEDDVVRVIHTATNHDKALTGLVVAALDVAKVDGSVVVIAGDADGVAETKGYEIARAPIDSRFSAPCDMANPLVFVSAERLVGFEQVSKPLSAALVAKRPLLIVAEAFDQAALTVIVGNAQRNGLGVMCLRAPGHTGSERRAMLEDLAVVVGARCVAADQGDTPTTFDAEKHLGGAELARVGRETTRLVMPHGKAEAIEARAARVAAELGGGARAANMRGRSAVITLAPSTPADEQERRDRIDDALHAARAAIKGGVVQGGCAVYVRAIEPMESDGDVGSAVNRALWRALEAPLRAIATNAGLKPDVVVDALQREAVVSGWDDLVYDVVVDAPVNAGRAGIIDPALVPLTALREAVTAARMLVLTSAAVMP